MRYTKRRTRLGSFREWMYNSRDSIEPFVIYQYAVVHKITSLYQALKAELHFHVYLKQL